MALIEALLDAYRASGFDIRINSDRSLSITPTFSITPKVELPVDGQQYKITKEPFLDCSLNIFVSGLNGGFTVDPTNKGLIARTPVAPITNASKMSGTTLFMRHGMWLIGIGYALDNRTTSQRDVGNVNKTFKVKFIGDSLHIERKIEHNIPQYALRYSVVITGDSALIIKELPPTQKGIAWRWFNRNIDRIIGIAIKYLKSG